MEEGEVEMPTRSICFHPGHLYVSGSRWGCCCVSDSVAKVSCEEGLKGSNQDHMAQVFWEALLSITVFVSFGCCSETHSLVDIINL